MRKYILILALCLSSFTVSFAQSWNITGNTGTNSSTNFLGTADSTTLVFRTNNKERMRIFSNGKVGIGITNPAQKLHVNGNINIGKGFALYMENHPVLRVDSLKENTFLGTGTGANNTGTDNTAIGYLALVANTTGSFNVAAGPFALYNNTGAFNNIAVGQAALYSNTIGSRNIAHGRNALFSNISGGENIAGGTNALYSNTTGSSNIAFGESALYTNSSGNVNFATGPYALAQNITGSYNIANGYQALLSNITGSYNIAIGPDALNSNFNGGQNTAIGNLALAGNGDSWNNTALGYDAGYPFNNGWNNTFLGADAAAAIQGVFNSIAIGNAATVTASNQVRIGNNSTASIGGFSNWTNISDGRIKKNIKENVPGLAFINKLTPVTYNLDLDAAEKIVQSQTINNKDNKPAHKFSETEINARNAKQQIIYTGFVAQEVEKAAKELNYDFSGIDVAKNDKDLYGLRYAEFVVPLAKAVQELSAMNEALQKQNTQLQTEIDELRAMIVADKSMFNNQQSINNQVVKLTSSEWGVEGAILSQNVPNPVNQNTVISYNLPQDVNKASINIININGVLMKTINISAKGSGHLTIDGSRLLPGSYKYSLYADGKLIDTKTMLVKK